MHDVVILFSGGADSMLMLEMALEGGLNPYCVMIDYEQLHKEELEVASKFLVNRNIPYQIVKLHGLNLSSGLTGDGDKGRFDGVHEMHVPSRNMMFVGIAASIAENMGCERIWYGADLSDFFNQFPDCMQHWVASMNMTLKINGPKPINLEAPLLGLTKETILQLLKKRGFSEDQFFSGYGDL
ncbi:MAG: 7-cyano-7-deazaguanine synthase [Melioribacteraceae bacterium]|nr:7-cyano-7-deazaguanine synthase [Melioribacteraceae bacterium]